MADIIIGRLVYEVTQVGLEQLKQQLLDLTREPLTINVGRSQREISGLESQIQRLRNRVAGLRNEFTAAGGDVGRYMQSLKAARDEALKLTEGLDRESRAFAQLTAIAASAQRGIVSALRAQANAVTPVQEQIARLQNQVHGLRNQYIAVGGSATQFAIRMRQVRDEALEAARGLSETSKEFRQLMTVAAQAERAATAATGGISRLGLASQVRAGMASLMRGVGWMLPGPAGSLLFATSSLAYAFRGMSPAMATTTAGLMAMTGAMAIGVSEASRLQHEQRMLEAITLQTAGAYDELTRGLMRASTVMPITASEMYKAAAEAARLGVEGAENILAFTEAVQGLAYITRGNVGEIATDLAKFMNELGITPRRADYVQQVRSIANSLAAVQTVSAATADEILNLSRYFASVATQVGLTGDQIIALAGSLVALGARAQSGGTNIARWFLEMARAAQQNTKELAAMAEIAGMSRTEFRELVRTDIVAAFIRFARGLGDAHGSAARFAEAMERVGARNQRLIQVLGQASVGIDEFVNNLEVAVRASQEQTYLTDVLANATSNLRDQWAMTRNTLRSIFSILAEPIVESFTLRLMNLNDRLRELYDRFDALNEEQLRAISSAASVAIGFTGIVAAAGLVSKALSLLTVGFSALGGLGAIITSPITLGLLGIAATVALVKKAWDDDWFNMRTNAIEAVDKIEKRWENFKAAFRDEEGKFKLPDLQAPNWSEVIDSAEQTLRDAIYRIEAYLRGGSPDIPEDEWRRQNFRLPSVSMPDWSAVIDTGLEEAKASWQAAKDFFSLEIQGLTLSMPALEKPNWSSTINEALNSAQISWSEASQFFEEVAAHPRFDIPDIEVPDWSARINDARTRLEASVEETRQYIEGLTWPTLAAIEAPAIVAPDWSVLEPPESVIASVERLKVTFGNLKEEIANFEGLNWEAFLPKEKITQATESTIADALSQGIAKGTQAVLESPKGQVVLNVGELAGEVMAGEKTLKEALMEALTRSIAISLPSAIISLLPISTGWKLALLGVTLALQFAAQALPELEGLEGENGILARIKSIIEEKIKSFDLSFDLPEINLSFGNVLDTLNQITAAIRETRSQLDFGDLAQKTREYGREVGENLYGGATFVISEMAKTGVAAGRGLLRFWEFLYELDLAMSGFFREIALFVFELGHELGENIVINFFKGVIEGFLSAPIDYIKGLFAPVRQYIESVLGISLAPGEETLSPAERITPSPEVLEAIRTSGARYELVPTDLMLLLAQQQSGMRPYPATGGPFRLRAWQLEALKQHGLGFGLSVFPGTDYVTGEVQDLIQGAFHFAELMFLTYLPRYREQIQSQMERLSLSPVEAFFLAWQDLERFLDAQTLQDVITVVDGAQVTIAEYLESLRQTLETYSLWLPETNRVLTELLGTTQNQSQAISRLEQITGNVGLERLLDAIYIAEGGPSATWLYGTRGFAEQGYKFKQPQNQELFDRIVQELELTPFTEEWFRAAAAVTVTWYWEQFKKQFLQGAQVTFAELAPEIQAQFVRWFSSMWADPSLDARNVNFPRNVLYYLGLSGYSSGTPWTGWGPLDEPVGVVHRQEAVIPWKVLREGPGAVLEFLGYPGFQEGLPPEVQLALTQGESTLQQMVGGMANSLTVVNSELGRLPEALASLRRKIEEWGPDRLGENLYNDALALLDTLEGASNRFAAWVQNFVSAVNILVHGRPPQVDTEVPTKSETPAELTPEQQKRFWERFFDWLRRGWQNILDQAVTFSMDVTDWAGVASNSLRAFAAAIDETAGVLAQVSRRMVEYVTFDLQTGTFDLEATVRRAINDVFATLASALAKFLTTTAESLQRQSRARIGPGEDRLTIEEMYRNIAEAEENRRRLDEQYERLAAQYRAIELATVGGTGVGAGLGALIGNLVLPGIGTLLGAAIGGAIGAAGGRAAAQRALENEIQATQEQIAELERALTDYMQRLREALGLTANDIASAVQRAFTASSIEDMTDISGRIVEGFRTRLTDALNDIIRGALIQQFIGTVIAEPISQLAASVFDDIVKGAGPDMEQVRQAIEVITDQAQPFYEMLEELGLAGEDAADALRRTTAELSNVPTVFKLALRTFQVSEGIPSFAVGGFVPPTPGGTVVRVAEAGEGEWIIPESRMRSMSQTIQINVDMRGSTVYGETDLDRKIRRSIADALQSARSLQYGFAP